MISKMGIPSAGWRSNLAKIGTYGADYLGRAGIAIVGLGSNTIEDSVYPTAFTDAEGKPFSSDSRYILHFNKDQVPPVRAFWSLTMYTEEQRLAANPIDRFALGDRDKLAFNPDGSLDLYIQRESPGRDKESNWLPAPASGSFTMNLRLYWPKAQVLDRHVGPPGGHVGEMSKEQLEASPLTTRQTMKARKGMPKFDIAKLNAAVDKLLETTDNPRHRFLLQAFGRHRHLEVSGRYEEICAPDMMITDPVYHFHYTGLEFELRGQDQVKGLYRMWAETNQIFFPIHEEVAVADHFVASFATAYQQVLGKGQRQAAFLSYLPSAVADKLLKKELEKSQHRADSSDMFLYKTTGILICPYDDQGRLAGEEVWEPDSSEAELIKLDPADVLTTEEAAKVLVPLTKPLPSFDEVVLQRKAVAR